jgi:hypothetical protein
MKEELQRLNIANKPSPISEGVVEIRVNSQPCKGINLTTQHTQARRAPRVEKNAQHDQGNDQGPPHPSARLPHMSQRTHRGWPMHYPDVHPLGMVG